MRQHDRPKLLLDSIRVFPEGSLMTQSFSFWLG
jgi:hypothetical protein